MRKKIQWTIIIVAVLIATVGQARAAVITFNGTAPDGSSVNCNESYSENGFTIDFNSPQSMFFLDNEYNSSLFPTLAGFDDDVLESLAEFNLVSDDGLSFDLNSVDVSASTKNGGTGDFIFTGIFSDGSQISQTVTANKAGISSVSFSDFTDLSSLKVTKTNRELLIMDNLSVTAASPPTVTPEPFSLAVWGGLGMIGAGAGAVRRRREKKTA